MPAIQQQTWDEIQVLTWGDLDQNLYLDFRIALVDGLIEAQAQGVDLSIGKSAIEGIVEMLVQGVKIEFSPAIVQVRAEIVVSSNVSRRDYKGDMLKLLPSYYNNSRLFGSLLDTYTKELRGLEFKLDTVQDSYFVDSVVENIIRWEQDLGIASDVSKPYNFRREKVKAKLRAVGTTTKAMIETVAAAFSDGQVEVIEDNASYAFRVKFTGTKGTPANMTDLTAILEEIKPAHLAFSYDYTYNTWSFLADKTWQEVSALTWAEIQTFN
ncbi:putative phage tail protein [Desulfosporosinus nitroreducens]|uniref:putative phage tail protein n=1 Tax=Desulfosporosinus nitroreducens TaxID=2018668 RepID=UPI00207D5590|nr:putative phage tail protein [Desulfosporosinus nitroreducens]MCO1599816.1 YmfQ family protein [Desulfosporosinus nitroreducens]